MGGDHLWEAIGAIGEIIGAAAVVVTLIYLAQQIYQSDQTASTSSMHASSMSAVDLLVTQAQPENASLLFRGGIDFEALNPEERFRFSLLMRANFQWYDNAFAQSELSKLGETYWASRTRSTLQVFLRTPGIRSYWQSDREFYRESFRNVIDRLVSETENRIS